MQRFVLVAAVGAALAGTAAGVAHATTYAGTTTPAPAGFAAMSNVELMALRSGVPVPPDVLAGNDRTPGFGLANEPGLTSGGFVPSDLTSGGPLAGVPEPAAWMMLIAGFGLVGLVTRRRKAAVAA